MIGTTKDDETIAFLTTDEFIELYAKRRLKGDHYGAQGAKGRLEIRIRRYHQPRHSYKERRKPDGLESVLITLNDDYARQVSVQEKGTFVYRSHGIRLRSTENLDHDLQRVYDNLDKEAL